MDECSREKNEETIKKRGPSCSGREGGNRRISKAREIGGGGERKGDRGGGGSCKKE